MRTAPYDLQERTYIGRRVNLYRSRCEAILVKTTTYIALD
ncbi:hypothetical protein HMPREF3185_00130 [Porphyromonas somerae]|uniref:Uncharacterized protein n=1 Tax=Porphyromonas somerae TaxID=322095 RepID=A0A134BEV7_9PORP|nr:hypothetical protein HMPREF3184_00130 [Porphyromonadaceae bacterium KA00676]KXB78482.1 hypothetical protein HMPREF3185_00130 [Porphyromonas somerae]